MDRPAGRRLGGWLWLLAAVGILAGTTVGLMVRSTGGDSKGSPPSVPTTALAPPEGPARVPAVEVAEPPDLGWAHEGMTLAEALDADGEPEYGGRLTVAIAAESGGWDPTTSVWDLSGRLVAASMVEPLMLMSEDGRPSPFLAEEVVANGDGTVWTIRLRPGITFHDGSALTAQVVRENLDARRFSALWSGSLSLVEDVVVVDDRTVEVAMSDPWTTFDVQLTSQLGMIVTRDSLGNGDPITGPVGTGPFRFVEWVQDQRLRVERSDRYWRDGLPYLDAIDFVPIPDERARTGALRAGDVDLVLTQDQELVDGRDELVLVRDRDTSAVALALNTAIPPFDDPRARAAVHLAVDRELLVELLVPGGESADQPYASASTWHVGTALPAPSPDLARDLAAQYEDEHGPLEFEIMAAPGVRSLETLQLLQVQLAEAGLEVDLVIEDAATMTLDRLVGNYGAALVQSFDATHPDLNHDLLHSSASRPVGDISINETRTADADLDAALDAGRGADDPDGRAVAYATVTNELNELGSYVWLYHEPWYLAAQPTVGGTAYPGVLGIASGGAPVWTGELFLRAG